MTGLAAKILGLHSALDAGDVPHAFGGALALAWCTASARGTIDIDVNIFLGVEDVERLDAALPSEVPLPVRDRARLVDQGQVRLWWGRTPVDLFLDTTPFHEQAALRVRLHDFGGVSLPFLSCDDLAVFKAFFDRTKDWADLEAMSTAGSLDLERVAGVLAVHLGGHDARLSRLLGLPPPQREERPQPN